MTAGCSKPDDNANYVPAKVEKAPDEVGGVKAPATTGTATPTAPAKTTATSAVTPPTAKPGPSKLELELKALSDYSAKIKPILYADNAEQVFRESVKKAGPDMETKGWAALIPHYQRYEHAVKGIADKLKLITPPPAAKGVHDAFVSIYGRLYDNLRLSVDAMIKNDGQTAAQLSHERKGILKNGDDSLKKALAAGNFDEPLFRSRTELLPLK